MKAIFFVALFLVFALCLTESQKLWTDCSSADDKTRLEVKSIAVTPHPLQKGHHVYVEMDFKLKEELTSGKLSLQIMYGAVPIIDESLDLCDLLAQVNLKCPIQKSNIPLQLKEYISTYFPSGRYEGNVTATDQNKKEIVCLHMELDLK